MKNLPFLIIAIFAAVTVSAIFGVYGIVFVAAFAAGFTFKSLLKDNTVKVSDDCTDGISCDPTDKIGAPTGGISRPSSKK
jgi:hypothetical protein